MKKILIIPPLIFIAALLALFLLKQTPARFVLDNYLMGTYDAGLSESDLIKKRNVDIRGVKFVVPPQWVVMKNFPEKGFITFDLDLPNVDGSIEVSVYQGKNFDNAEIVESYVSEISTLKGKFSPHDIKTKKVNGDEWRIISVQDRVELGSRNTGVYYGIANDSLVVIYFFSIGELSAIEVEVENLISRF